MLTCTYVVDPGVTIIFTNKIFVARQFSPKKTIYIACEYDDTLELHYNLQKK